MTDSGTYLRVGIPVIIILLAGILITLLLSSANNSSDPSSEYKSAFMRNYKILSPEIPEKINFAGEPVPLNLFYVREALDKEIIVNTFWQSNTLLMMKRAWRFFPVIEPVLKENNVPDDFKYLALIESGFENVVSPSGAAGFWQFMKSTATSFNLEINDEVDERYNLVKSTNAACRFLKEARQKTGSWTMAAAAYNMGASGLSSQSQTQKSNNFYDLSLNAETSRYVYRILALKIIFSNPVNYGFYLRKYDLYQPIPVENYTIDTSVADLAELAAKLKVNYKTLKFFNPWLRKNNLKNINKKKYIITLPAPEYLNSDKLLDLFRNDEFIYKDTLRVNQIR